MARNEEKAQSMLNRYLAGKQEEKRGPKQKRPFLASECNDLNDADKWRQQILREIGRKVMEIQNAGLGEHRIRDLNDEINKLIREKGHWERHIVELGGVDYAKAAPKLTDSDGSIIQQGPGREGGYRYFGAAKQLPGVKELFEKEPPKQVKRSRHEMYKNIDADYYGFRDEEDGVLVRLEAEAEVELRTRLVREWEEKDQERRAAMAGMSGREGEASASGERGAGGGSGESAAQFVAYVPLPDSKEIERQVLKKKKEDLLARYTSEHLAKQQEEAKTMLNQR